MTEEDYWASDPDFDETRRDGRTYADTEIGSLGMARTGVRSHAWFGGFGFHARAPGRCWELERMKAKRR